MAYVTTQNLCAGMVVARNLLDRNQRVLLRAGVALSESHIRALHSLGVAGLEIRGGHVPSPLFPAGREGGVQPSARQESAATASTPEKERPARIESTLRTLQVTRPASKPLRPKLEPVMARQSEALLNHLLEGTAVKRDSALAAVVQLCTLRLLRAKSVKDQTSVR